MNNNIRENVVYEIAVIGGGPAGMIAAGRAAQRGKRVILLERNSSLGKKLLITGKGRCNFTHYELDKKKLAEKFGKNGRFLYSSLDRFGVSEVLKFFQFRGLSWQIERGNRVFPKEGDARDILRLLMEYLKEGKVQIICNAEVDDLSPVQHKKPSFRIVYSGEEILSEKVIVCTGGKSYPQTGSKGDGYLWAKRMGHTIIEPIPALNPVKTSEPWVKKVQGLTLKNFSLNLIQDGKKRDERFG